jgi:dephospho-CoA kinase
MLRVGLTGELGTGKSTVARLLAEHGAHVFSSDEMGRALMQPGQRVCDEIVKRFGPAVVKADGELDRGALARLAFDPVNPRVEELNAIVHPAVLAEQARLLTELEEREPDAIAVVESALIFSTRHAGEAGWRARFDEVLLVIAPEPVKVRRFVERLGALDADARLQAENDARRRLAMQAFRPEDVARCRMIENTGSLDALRAEVDRVWTQLVAAEAAK